MDYRIVYVRTYVIIRMHTGVRHTEKGDSTTSVFVSEQLTMFLLLLLLLLLLYSGHSQQADYYATF